MERKAVSGIMLTLILLGMLTLAFNIQPVKAGGTIYIRADGSIDPSTAPIQRNGNLYTFTDNIYDSIVVERSNIVVDGAGFTLQGPGSGFGFGCSSTNNVTIKNTNIKNYDYGIVLSSSSNGTISGNTITANKHQGILLANSSNNTISGNTITATQYEGILLYLSSNNTISENIVTANNASEIFLRLSSNNTISGNTITGSKEAGIWLLDFSQNNTIFGNTIANNAGGIGIDGLQFSGSNGNVVYHNSFVDNTVQTGGSSSSLNVWDDGYPSGGNFWSDYEERYPDAEELDDSGIWSTPYVIDENNQDNYPLMEPWAPAPPVPTTIGELKTKIEELGSEGEIDNQGIVRSLLAKLDVAQKLVDQGKIDEAKTILEEDFIIQVQNLSGIHITPEAADTLIKSAEYIISHL